MAPTRWKNPIRTRSEPYEPTHNISGWMPFFVLFFLMEPRVGTEEPHGRKSTKKKNILNSIAEIIEILIRLTFSRWALKEQCSTFTRILIGPNLKNSLKPSSTQWNPIKLSKTQKKNE